MSGDRIRYWVRGTDQQTYGPVDVPALQSWVHNGTVTAETLVCREDDPSNQWIRASGIVGLQFSVARPSPIPQPPPAPPAKSAADVQTAKKIIVWSRILGWGGLGLVFVLCPISVVAGAEEGGVLIATLGFLSAIAGAVLGQIGRAMQGRVL